MIEPPPPAAILGIANFDVKAMLLRSTSRQRSHASSSISVTLPKHEMPTQLASISILPKCSIAVSTKRSQSPGFDTSAIQTAASSPSAAKAQRVVSAFSHSKSTSSTRAPSRAKSVAVARPTPMPSPARVPAPVTIATFAVNLSVM